MERRKKKVNTKRKREKKIDTKIREKKRKKKKEADGSFENDFFITVKIFLMNLQAT
jgi:hypothetical protein